MVLHISMYCIIRCLLSPFSAISRRFLIRARVGDDILDLCGLLIALASLDAFCWVMSQMVSLKVSMSPSFCSVSSRFHNSGWNATFFDPIHVTFNVGGLLVINFVLSTSISILMLLITSLWSLPMLTWLMTVTSVMMSGLFVRMQSISVFITPFGLFHVIHFLPAFFWNIAFVILYFLDVAHSTNVSPLSFLNSNPKLPVTVSVGIVLFPI